MNADAPKNLGFTNESAEGDRGFTPKATAENTPPAPLSLIPSASKRPHQDWRLWLPAILGVILLGLNLLHLRHTDVALQVETSIVRFTSAVDQVFLSPIAVRGVSATAVESLDCDMAGCAGFLRGVDSLEILAVAISDKRSSLTFGAFDVPGETHLIISADPGNSDYDVSVKAKRPLTLRVTLLGTADLKGGKSGIRRLTCSSPCEVRLRCRANGADFRFRSKEATEVPFARHIRVTDLSFTDVEELSAQDRNYPNVVSGITTGSLSLLEADSLPRQLRWGDSLRLKVSAGYLFLDRATSGRLECRLLGRVEDILTGPVDAEQNLMPSWFEYLRARRSWIVLGGLLIVTVPMFYKLLIFLSPK